VVTYARAGGVTVTVTEAVNDPATAVTVVVPGALAVTRKPATAATDGFDDVSRVPVGIGLMEPSV
jgi:hypothetical protein